MIDMVGVTKNVLVFKSKNYIYGIYNISSTFCKRCTLEADNDA